MSLISDLLLALILTLPLGCALLRRFFQAVNINWAFSLSSAFFLGLLTDILLLNILQWMPFLVSAKMAWMLLMGIHLAALVYCGWHWRQQRGRGAAIHYRRHHWLCLLLAVTGVLVLIFNMVMAYHLPILAWDAWSGWVAKAKIWHAEGLNAPIIATSSWLQQSMDTPAWTSHIWHYPDTIGLLYAVFAAFDTTVEPGAVLLWPLTSGFLALGIAGYLTGLKRSLCQQPMALGAAVLLLLTPLWWQHSVLAGYADLLFAACLWQAVAHYSLWQQTRCRAHRRLAMVFLLALPFIKLFGWLTMAIAVFIIRWQLAKNRFWWFMRQMAILAVIVVFFWLMLPLSFDTPAGRFVLDRQYWQLPGFGTIRLGWHGSLWPWLEGLVFSRNWLLLWLALPVVIWQGMSRGQPGRPATFFVSMLICYLFVIVCLYSLTGFSQFAETFTSSNRMLLHVYPLLLTAAFLLLDETGPSAEQRQHSWQ